MLRTLLLAEDESKWASKLAYIEFGINTTVHVSTGKSPYELVFGKSPKLPCDVTIKNKDSKLTVCLQFT